MPQTIDFQIEQERFFPLLAAPPHATSATNFHMQDCA